VIPIRDENPTSRRPFVTLAIIAACIIVYFFVQPTPFSTTTADAEFDYRHAAIPLELKQREPLSNCQVARAAASPANAAEVCASSFGRQQFAPDKNLWLSMVNSLFLHGGLVHLGGNLLFLWVFGNNVEDRLGHVFFALFYLAAGFVSLAGHTLVNLTSASPVIGASGAIAGVMGAYLVWYPRAKIDTLVFPIFWLRLQARWVLLAWFVLQFFTSPNSGVAWAAHVIGFAFGAAVGVLVGKPRRPSPTPWPPPPTW
jgi:membrane associated rhomboid family serine protease